MLWIKKATLLNTPLWLTRPGDIYVLAVTEPVFEHGDIVRLRCFDWNIHRGVQEIKLQVVGQVWGRNMEVLSYLFCHIEGGIRNTKVNEGASLLVLMEEL